MLSAPSSVEVRFRFTTAFHAQRSDVAHLEIEQTEWQGREMRTLVTGATGLIGRALIDRLGHAVVLTRDLERAKRKLPMVESHAWSPEAGPPRAAALDGVEGVLKLPADPVAGA